MRAGDNHAVNHAASCASYVAATAARPLAAPGNRHVGDGGVVGVLRRGSAVGPIEALVRLESLYDTADTLTRHTDASQRKGQKQPAQAHIPPNHSPVRSMSGAQVTDGPEPHVTDRAITNPGN
jgi:hypothetical protein